MSENLKKQELKELNIEILNEINGGGILYDLGRAAGNLFMGNRGRYIIGPIMRPLNMN